MVRIKSGLSVGISLMALCLPLLAQTNNITNSVTNSVPVGTGPIYSLEQFGAISNAAVAEATFQKASSDIIAGGGGILLIPVNTPASWVPKNNTQHEFRSPAPPASAKNWHPGLGITVVDARGRRPVVQPPQVTGLEINRVLNLAPGESLPSWDMDPVIELKNTILRGSTSYHDWLQADVKAGADRRFYVATIRGIFPGEFLNTIYNRAGVDRLYVKSIGYDKEKKMWYLVADTPIDVQKGAILSNKNHVNSIKMDTYSHNENQTFDVWVERHNYSQGDNYIFDARNMYMGDAHSTAGDENNVLYAAFVNSDSSIFRGEVEKWDAATDELVFKHGPTGGTLGTGRPIINLNPAKWVTNGTVNIVRPASYIEYNKPLDNPTYHGQTYPTAVVPNKIGMGSLHMGGLIRFSADAPVTDEVVGRYFAVDEPDEYVAQTKDVRRWYLIDSVTKNADGTKDMQIIRHWWGAKSAGSPTLYKPESYSWDGHEKPLRYIIAPGANAYDVADGVNNPKRTIRLAPTSFTGTPADFAAADPVEQAMGPDPFKPIPFRSWMWDAVPGAFPSTVFDIANAGVMRDSVLYLHWGSTDIEKEKATRYDRNPMWDKYLNFEATCNTGIKFAADTGNAAILFTQPFHEQLLKWNYDITTNRPPKVASLTVSRDTGEFSFDGGNLRVNGSVAANGLSGDKTPARNLRGKDIVVEAGKTTVTITFANVEMDASYAVFVEQSWLGNRAITKKDATGFTIQFEKPAPADAKLDWMIVR